MSEHQAVYQVGNEKLRDQEILQALRDVLKSGYGQVLIIIANYQVDSVEKTISVKMKK